MDQPSKQRSRGLLHEAQHQLRQPLNALSLLIGELRQGPGGGELNALAEEMRYALHLANSWLDALSEMQEVEAGLLEPKLQAVPLQSVFADLADEFSPRFAEQGLRFRIVPTRALVRADPAWLRQLLTRLLDNALKFTRSGTVLLGCRRAGDRLRVEVWDSGPGVTAEEAAQLFEPFVRLENEVRPRERGLGLGLAYARRLAELAGDRLTLRSRPGRGCCFALTLQPASEPAGQDRTGAAEPAPAAALVPDPLRGAPVLLLDGPETQPVRASLESWGMAVRPVAPAALPGALAAAAPLLLIADGVAFAAAGGWQAARQVPDADGKTIVLIGDEVPDRPERPNLAVHHLQRPVRPARLRALCHFALSRAGNAAPPG